VLTRPDPTQVISTIDGHAPPPPTSASFSNDLPRRAIGVHPGRWDEIVPMFRKARPVQSEGRVEWGQRSSAQGRRCGGEHRPSFPTTTARCDHENRLRGRIRELDREGGGEGIANGNPKTNRRRLRGEVRLTKSDSRQRRVCSRADVREPTSLISENPSRGERGESGATKYARRVGKSASCHTFTLRRRS
jgi:hypothetical protein